MKTNRRKVFLVLGLFMIALLLAVGCAQTPVSSPTVAPSTAVQPTSTAPAPVQPTSTAPASPSSTQPPVAKVEPIVLKAVTFVPINTGEGIGFKSLMDKVNKETNGQVIIKLVGGPEAIPAFDQFEAVRSGVVDIAYTPEAYYGAKITGTAYNHVTQLTPWEERASGYTAFRRDLVGKFNVYDWGKTMHTVPFHLWVKKPIATPKEFVGKKIRVSAVYVPFVQALGAAPLVTPPPEVYTALERGVVDGFGWSALGVVDFGWQDVCKNMITTDIYQAVIETSVNLEKWNSMPKATQTLLENIMIAHEKEVTSIWTDAMAKEMKKYQDSGVNFIKFSAEDAKAYSDLAYSSAWADIMKNIRPVEIGPKLKTFLSK